MQPPLGLVTGLLAGIGAAITPTPAGLVQSA
jgi:hypothetical protein